MRALEGGRHNSSSRLPRFASGSSVRDGVEAPDVEAAKNPDLPGIMSLGSGDDDVISAMLESSHSQGSLAAVMAPLTSPDIYASFSSHAAAFHHQQAPGGGGLARASSMSQAGLSCQPQQQQQQQRSNERWDEKWMLDVKGEVLAMHSAAFGADFESFMMPPASSGGGGGGGGGGLHRYHSAPSTFLQALADDAFPQIPLLTPITEQMDVERGVSGSEFEQFLAPDSEFSRRAALSALSKTETTVELVPQNSPSVAQPRQDPPEEHHSEESLSGTSEDNSLRASMYHDLLPRDSWPTSPGTSKRPRGFPLESDPAAGEFRNGLIRHASLPTPSASAAAAAAAPSADDHYVQMRARAKRGCATHPRSIAERVRRTRISERMKKLQDLVPNMEKTTNTSDMLDETVEYVKSLQMQVNELNETIAKLRAATQSTASP